ncbi:MAG: methyltransferase domain-containing protein [Solirubrobacterales bacterium]|nr:methyltransferase domain-containing protein [Solirubrobacterales bacterium]
MIPWPASDRTRTRRPLGARRPSAAPDDGRDGTRSCAGLPGPDLNLALARYRELAGAYDLLTEWAAPYREQAIDALELGRGELVVDVGCGTGLNFSAIEDRIGARGALVGVDACPAMLDHAAKRARQAGWDNVELVCAPAEDARLPCPGDAMLLCATHDVLRSPTGLGNMLGQLTAGAPVVAAGPKWAPWWLPGAAAINLAVWWINLPYVTTFEGFAHPWSHLHRFVEDLIVRQASSGTYYLASGRRPEPGPC